jgi:predicted nucleotidyltransferase
MITDKMITAVKTKLVATYNPITIYIFGSYAWGTPDDDSDLDLLVVVDKLINTRHRMLVDGHRALGDLDLSKDLLLYSKDEFEELSEDEMALCYRVKREGLQIYAKA